MSDVVVIGGTGDIGLAVCRAFIDAGQEVFATGYDPKEVHDARHAIPSRQFQADRLDITSILEVEAFAARFARISTLVNAAGVVAPGGAEYDPATFARVVDVNLTGMLRTATAFRQQLAAAGGSIVNIASMLSFFGSANAPAYSSSKGGVVQLTKSLAVAWAAEGIRVNAVAPGWIATKFNRPLWTDTDRSSQILGRTPMRRWGKPADVAGPIVFLASPAAAFVTGAVLPIDGGYLAC